ncbi:hypothetical protein BJ170DRAFT_598242 [Xylariales sp. AK1849]|nr:hypothetical protein BJ170DRAFT_598242 [Xylariales sp. AK1849]
MRRVDWLRQRFKVAKGRVAKMIGRTPSFSAGDNMADKVARDRATAQAQLEGKIAPVVPSRSGGRSQKKRQDGAAGARDSVRDSRRSFMERHFAMSLAATGYGQGVGWIGGDVEASQYDEYFVPTRLSMYPEDGPDRTSGKLSFVKQATRRRSRFHYSMIDPTLGIGHSSSHESDEAHSEQASYIRALVDSGSFDMEHLHLARESIMDPGFRTALHSALENYPPEVASRILESADTDDRNDEATRRDVLSPLRKARHSIQLVSKRVLHDARSVGNRWSRVSQAKPDYGVYENPPKAKKAWLRVVGKTKAPGSRGHVGH